MRAIFETTKNLEIFSHPEGRSKKEGWSHFGSV